MNQAVVIHSLSYALETRNQGGNALSIGVKCKNGGYIGMKNKYMAMGYYTTPLYEFSSDKEATEFFKKVFEGHPFVVLKVVD